MAIKIGINENVFLQSAVMDDKNVLELKFEEASKEKKSYFADVAADEVTENTDMGIRLFPALPPKKDDMTDAKKVDLVVSDINGTKGILRHLLLGYLTSEDLKGLWAHAYDGLTITEENFPQMVLKKEVLEGIHKNMVRVFLEKIRPFLNNKELTFRLLLVRQSKDKHFATFRKRYIEDNPFYESMQIPKEASKVAFTPYEIREGLDNGLPAQKSDSADKKGDGAGGTAPVTAANVFGQ